MNDTEERWREEENDVFSKNHQKYNKTALGSDLSGFENFRCENHTKFDFGGVYLSIEAHLRVKMNFFQRGSSCQSPEGIIGDGPDSDLNIPRRRRSGMRMATQCLHGKMERRAKMTTSSTPIWT